MARKHSRPAAAMQRFLEPARKQCWACAGPLWMVYHTVRTVATLDGLCRVTLTVRRCENPACALYHRPYRPEEESAVALPHGEFSLDIIALIGTLRYAEHRSVPEIHRTLQGRGIRIPDRTLTLLVQGIKELLASRLADQTRLGDRLPAQAPVARALAGFQRSLGMEVSWLL